MENILRLRHKLISEFKQKSNLHRNTIDKVLRRLYQVYKWLAFAPLFVLLTTIHGGLIVAGSFFFSARDTNKIGALWGFLCAKLAPMSVSVEGRENIDPRQSYVVVSNHLSHFDILALYGWLGIDFRWVMKMELRKTPVLGIACEKMGHVFIDRSNTAKALASIKEAEKKIRNGTSILFFPEGTRSLNGAMGEFKKGAFKMALDLNLPVLPVSISGTQNVLPPKTLNLFPGKARMVIHPPIRIDGDGDIAIEKLMGKTRKTIAKGVAETVD